MAETLYGSRHENTVTSRFNLGAVYEASGVFFVFGCESVSVDTTGAVGSEQMKRRTMDGCTGTSKKLMFGDLAATSTFTCTFARYGPHVFGGQVIWRPRVTPSKLYLRIDVLTATMVGSLTLCR